MDFKSDVLAGIDFLLRSLRPDHWEKFVLPGIMSLLLLGGAFSTVSLQNGYAEKTLNVTLESLTDRQVLVIQDNHFPSSLDTAFEERNKEITQKKLNQINEMRSEGFFAMKGWLSRLLYDSGAFPNVPEKKMAPWGPEKEYVKTVTLLRYRTAKIQDLGDKATVSASYSYEEFQRDVEQIRSQSWKSEEVENFIEQSEEDASLNLDFIGGTSLQEVKSDGIKDIGLLNFLPSLVLTFLIYYFVGAVSVQGNIELVNRMKDQDDAIVDQPTQQK